MIDILQIFTTAEAWISLLTLTILEIVLGVDNIIFISIVTGKLKKEQQLSSRRLGLFLALFIRIILLAFISHIVHDMVVPVFYLGGHGFSWHDIILFGGGVFLLYKSAIELYEKIETGEHEAGAKPAKSYWNVVIQVILIDIVFSFDSIITAVAIAKDLPIMILAVIISMIMMMIFSHKIGDFINHNPTMKILALAFLFMIGALLTVEAFGVHVEKSYIYFALAFSIMVEMLNLRYRKKVVHHK
ncbi:MAG: TerC family protein [Bacteroidetes bacterium]|nr:TerC family protein [Bacteroidota bacterium]